MPPGSQNPGVMEDEPPKSPRSAESCGGKFLRPQFVATETESAGDVDTISGDPNLQQAIHG